MISLMGNITFWKTVHEYEIRDMNIYLYTNNPSYCIFVVSQYFINDYTESRYSIVCSVSLMSLGNQNIWCTQITDSWTMAQ